MPEHEPEASLGSTDGAIGGAEGVIVVDGVGVGDGSTVGVGVTAHPHKEATCGIGSAEHDVSVLLTWFPRDVCCLKHV